MGFIGFHCNSISIAEIVDPPKCDGEIYIRCLMLRYNGSATAEKTVGGPPFGTYVFMSDIVHLGQSQKLALRQLGHPCLTEDAILNPTAQFTHRTNPSIYEIANWNWVSKWIIRNVKKFIKSGRPEPQYSILMAPLLFFDAETDDIL